MRKEACAGVPSESATHVSTATQVYFSAVWKRTSGETQDVIRRFLARRISFPECIAALDTALAGLIPRLQEGQLTRLGL